MMKLTVAPEPPTFSERVYLLGLRALAEQTGQPLPPGVPARPKGQKTFTPLVRANDDEHGLAGTPILKPEHIPPALIRDLWTEAISDLRMAYRDLCAYTCFRIHLVTGMATVDHAVPKSHDVHLAYTWSNFRLACHGVNSRKGADPQVLDPADIEDGWFVLSLISFKIAPALGLTPAQTKAVQHTIHTLKLNDGGPGERSEAFKEIWSRITDETPVGPSGRPTVNLDLLKREIKYLERHDPYLAAALRAAYLPPPAPAASGATPGADPAGGAGAPKP